ncbi:hypothetical protein, partial [Aquabacterium sp.]|uniref:hypothetical protein n=1 Tax=Aquabacterium sp. TaxID=1872578 RepID=UPI003D6D7150
MDHFEERKQTAQYWFNKAADLRASAGALWYCAQPDKSEDVSKSLGYWTGHSMNVATVSVFPMLCGLSLEL